MYFPNIDVLRGFAALSVVVYHVIELLPWPGFPIQGPLLWFRIGWLGVDLFFVISGFVITLTALQAYRSDATGFALPFMARRLGRIVPLHVLTVLLFLLFISPQLLSDPALSRHLGTHLLFLHNLAPATHSSINGANWSVGVEMQFYLTILLTAGWLSRFSPWRVVGVCLLLAWVWRAGVVAVCAARDAGPWLVFMGSTQLPGMLDEFGFGILLARLVLDGEQVIPPRFRGLWRRWGQSGWLWTALAVVTLWAPLTVYWSQADYWNTPAMVIFWRSAIALGFCAVVGATIFLVLPRPLDALLAPLRYLGRISYGIYLWHLLVINALLRSGVHDPLNFLALSLAFTLGLAAFSWHFFEQPLIRRSRIPPHWHPSRWLVPFTNRRHASREGYNR